ncbi:MAG: hypothetical protein JOZ41_18060 [Chloroflexi bacterium]|nr:hypothetical protein [Chloroflexota bacterium]
MDDALLRVTGPFADGCGHRYSLSYRGRDVRVRLVPCRMPPGWGICLDGDVRVSLSGYPYRCEEEAYQAALSRVQALIDPAASRGSRTR